MELIIEGKRKKTKNYKTLKELIKSEKINLEIYLVKKDNQIILEDEQLNDEDVLEFIKVVSGG